MRRMSALARITVLIYIHHTANAMSRSNVRHKNTEAVVLSTVVERDSPIFIAVSKKHALERPNATAIPIFISTIEGIQLNPQAVKATIAREIKEGMGVSRKIVFSDVPLWF